MMSRTPRLAVVGITPRSQQSRLVLCPHAGATGSAFKGHPDEANDRDDRHDGEQRCNADTQIEEAAKVLLRQLDN